MALFPSVKATTDERAMALPGDAILDHADVVMDRAFTLNAPPEDVWPWFVQLGKNRAGWYFPRWINWLFVRGSRGIWIIDPALQDLKIGKIIDDWGGKDGYFEVAQLDPPHALVHKSIRGNISISWAITLWSVGSGTRVIIRLRLKSGRKSWLMEHGGGFIDLLTIAALAAGLRQRLKD